MGVFDLVKALLSGTRVTSTEGDSYDDIVEAAFDELSSTTYLWDVDMGKTETYQKLVLPLNAAEKLGFVLYHREKIVNFFKSGKTIDYNDRPYREALIRNRLIQQIFLSKPDLGDEEWVQLINATIEYNAEKEFVYSWSWPVKIFIAQLQKKYKGETLPGDLLQALNRLSQAVKEYNNPYYAKERIKINEALENLVFSSVNGKNVVKPVYFMGKDSFSPYANDLIAELNEKERECWYRLIAFSLKATGSKPNAKFLKDTNAVLLDLGLDKFKSDILKLFKFVIRLKEKEESHTYTFNGSSYSYSSYEFLSAPTIESLKGFVWMCTALKEVEVLQSLAALSERCFRKIPGKGPAAAAVGNACLYTLAQAAGLEGVGHLSRLKLRIKQSSTQNLIDKYLVQAATERGVSVDEIEDLAVDEFELKDGERVFEVEGFKAILRVEKVGKVSLTWYKSDGSVQKTDPSVIKEKHPDLLKSIKATAKQIELGLSAQRDRIDRSFRSDRKMTRSYFQTYYLNHGLMSFLVKQLIWVIVAEDLRAEVMFLNGEVLDSRGNELSLPADYFVQLWHPATAEMDDVARWRSFLMERQLQQPVKQAYREIYLLTDAEINTRTYSNRMASHILKQHQFNSLAKIRGWKYSLMGAYDDGRYNEAAQLALPEYKLIAEYWVNEVNADNQYNETGIWNYISTDQVRFVSTENGELIELVDLPVKALSEVMRDVDLFVGVASVGNDPNWRDSGGISAYREYWEAYAFGELTEVAKNRREILERLIPRLKISKVASLSERFLVVKGKKRTYKIHLGSTNILMEPNDQYLCIVPDRSVKSSTDNVFLPFEGDTGLSVIISKALLLADDDKITDTSITRQIG